MVTVPGVDERGWEQGQLGVLALVAVACMYIGWVAHALFTPQPISRPEVNSIAVIPRENMLSGDWYFGQYQCVDDCSGHDAGFRWARSKGVRRPAQCEGSGSGSFGEGCMVYLEIVGRMRGAE